MMTWLVTGSAGFLGRHVLATLAPHRAAGDQVIGLDRAPSTDVTPQIVADLADPAGLARQIAAVRPDVVIHAAGRTPPAPPGELYRANTTATLHLLEALRAAGRGVRLVLVGSAAELGFVPVDQLPVAEEFACRPREPYALSKWYATAAALKARLPLEVVVGRIFNLNGPGLPVGQAFGHFAAQLGAPGPDPLPLTVGNLTARRDFVDVRDAAAALVALAVHGTPGLVYHIGTGESHSIGLGLDELIRLSGRDVSITVQPGSRRGVPDSRACIDRITTHTGWIPQIPFHRSLADLWSEARSRSTRTRPAA